MGWCLQARVLLASTKAAGMGLNVTCACRAIILDVWWNGAFEDQVRAIWQLPLPALAHCTPDQYTARATCT